MKKLIVIFVMAYACASLLFKSKICVAQKNTEADASTLRVILPVREVNRFISAPVFKVEDVPGARKYELRVTTSETELGDLLTMEEDITMEEDDNTFFLEKIWKDIQQGYFFWEITALDQDDREIKRTREYRAFKAVGFTGNIPKPKQPKEKYIKDIMAFNLSDAYKEKTQTPNVPPYFYHARILPDNTFSFVSFPAHHHSIFISSLLKYRSWITDLKIQKECLERAEALGQWNMDHRTPGDVYFANMPFSAVFNGKVSGKIEPCKSGAMGRAWLELYAVTGKEKYLQAAKDLGNSLAKTQREEGNWPYRANYITGEVNNSYSSTVVFSMIFLYDLASITGNKEHRKAYERARDWVMNVPVKEIRWQGSYEDVKSNSRMKYQGPTFIDAAEFVFFIARNPTEFKNPVELCHKLLCYTEDTFVFYDSNDPFIHQGYGPLVPCVGEQGYRSLPMPIHGAFFGKMLMSLYSLDSKPVYLAKAEAVFNAVTHAQNVLNDDGRGFTMIPRPDGTFLEGYKAKFWGCTHWYSLGFGTPDMMIDYLRFRKKHEDLVLQACKGKNSR